MSDMVTASYSSEPTYVLVTEAERNELYRLRDEVERMRPAAAAFADVLRYFVHPGHPGRPCLTTGWIPVEKVAEWREISTAVDGG